MSGLTVADIKVRLRAEIAQFERDLGKAHAAVGRLSDLGRKTEQTGRSLSIGVTAPLVLAGKAAFNMAVDFDTAMTRIRGLVGESKEQVEQWRGEIIKMTKEFPQSAKELADALYFITSSGVAAKDAMSVLRSAAMAATAGLGSTVTVADAVTSAINAYGSENLSAAKATAILVAAVREGKGEADDLAQVIGRVIPIAAEMGISFDQVAGSIAALTIGGLDAAEAVTAIRGVLSGLLNPSKQATKELEKAGLSVSGLRKELAEKGLFHVLTRLKGAFHQNSEGLSLVFENVRALVGALSLTGENAKQAEAIIKSLSETTENDLVNATNAAREAMGYKYQQAMNNARTAMMQLGVVAVPIFTMIAQKLQAVGEWFQRLRPGQQEFIAKMLAIAVVVGPALLILGRLVRTITFLGGGLIKATIALIGFGKGLAGVAAAEGAKGAAGALQKLGLALRTANPLIIAATAAIVAFTAGWVASNRAFKKDQINDAKKMADAYLELASSGKLTGDHVKYAIAQLKIFRGDGNKAAEAALGAAIATAQLNNELYKLRARGIDPKSLSVDTLDTLNQEKAAMRGLAAERRNAAVAALENASGTREMSDAQNDAAEAVKRAQSEMAQAVATGFGQIGSVVDSFRNDERFSPGEGKSPVALSSKMLGEYFQQKIRVAKEFQWRLEQLAKGGLTRSLLMELAAAGPDAMPVLKAIQSAGIGNVNKLQGQLDAILSQTQMTAMGSKAGKMVVPALANGGIVKRPTLALIGEAGPEKVTPLKRGDTGGGGGGPNVTIVVQGSVITENDLVSKVRDEFVRMTRRSPSLGFAR